jgi:hypothetical protein
VVGRISLDDPFEGADHHSIATGEPARIIASTGKNNYRSTHGDRTAAKSVDGYVKRPLEIVV